MPIHTTDAIILRTIDYSETSLIVWSFTRAFGRVHVIAKGARRARSPFEGALEPLVRGELVFYRKAKPEGLDIAKEFDLQDLHLGLRGDLDRLHRGLYVGELLTELSEPEVATPEAFDAAVETLVRLSAAPVETLELVLVRCQLALLRSAGLRPVLDRCARCGGPPFAEGADEAWFSPAQGGALCAACSGRGEPGRFPPNPPSDREVGTTPVSRALLRRLLAISLGRDVPAVPAQDLEVRRRLDLFLAWHLGREVRMARWLRPIVPPERREVTAAPRAAARGRSRAAARPARSAPRPS